MKFTTAIMRALEWRIVSLCVDFTIVFLLTGEFYLSAGICGASNTARTLVHALWIQRRGQE